MIRTFVFALVAMLSNIASARTPAPTNATATTNVQTAPKTISIQEMLMTGPSELKLYSLAMLTQDRFQGDVDDSFLPAFKICSNDAAMPVRSLTARLLGRFYIQGKDKPNQDAVALLMKLSKDDSSDVRYNAVYYGLTQIQNKSDGILNQLIDVAATDREQGLQDRIAESVKADREKVAKILDEKLKNGNNVAFYEIYEEFTGQKPAYDDKYLNMPSSRPRLIVFKAEGVEPETCKAELINALQAEGIEHPDVVISGVGDNHVLLLKTYITKDYLAVEKAFTNHPRFKIMQSMWLTPALEIQIDAMRKK